MRESYTDKILQGVVAQLKELRLAKGLSHETLAKKAKITRPAISHIENGKRKPSLLVCLRIAEGLDASLAVIISKAESKIKKSG